MWLLRMKASFVDPTGQSQNGHGTPSDADLVYFFVALLLVYQLVYWEYHAPTCQSPARFYHILKPILSLNIN